MCVISSFSAKQIQRLFDHFMVFGSTAEVVLVNCKYLIGQQFFVWYNVASFVSICPEDLRELSFRKIRF